MMYLLARLEETALSTLLRESGFAFFSSLTLHSLSLALVVGLNLAITLTVLRQRRAPASEQPNLYALTRFYPLHWFAVGVVFLSGLALLIAYPAKALTNLVFWGKLACLLFALITSRQLQHGLAHQAALVESPQPENSPQIENSPAMADATPPTWQLRLCLLAWFFTVSAGRFLAYTHSILLAARYY